MSSFISFCTALPANGLRDGWTSKAVTGETIQVKLVPGRAKGHQGPAAFERRLSGERNTNSLVPVKLISQR